MKKILIISAGLLLILWAGLFFIFKTGDISYIFLVPAIIIVLFLISMRHVIN